MARSRANAQCGLNQFGAQAMASRSARSVLARRYLRQQCRQVVPGVLAIFRVSCRANRGFKACWPAAARVVKMGHGRPLVGHSCANNSRSELRARRLPAKHGADRRGRASECRPPRCASLGNASARRQPERTARKLGGGQLAADGIKEPSGGGSMALGRNRHLSQATSNNTSSATSK